MVLVKFSPETRARPHGWGIQNKPENGLHVFYVVMPLVLSPNFAFSLTNSLGLILKSLFCFLESS